ncbi:MAG: DNA polymerase III subunit delta' [Chloroflexi bacterium]|nr:DNA polymerase III subunit delta' [Chloroflexota bacterium]
MTWDILGQEAITSLLERSLARGRLSQAYLLVGPAGVGKTTLATTLAAALNCQGEHPPCRTCLQCRRILGGLHADVAVLALQEPERELGIGRIRELQRSLNLQPFEGRCRVAIIREAERLSHEAANALLKTLEEPPPEVVLVLTTTAEEEVLPTIRSRCQRLLLHPVPRAELLRFLQEDRGVPAATAQRLAAYSGGCPGRALRALAEPQLLEADVPLLERLTAILEGDTALRLTEGGRITGGFTGQRERALQALECWRNWWRDLLLVQAGCREGLAYPQEVASYARYTQRWEASATREALGCLQQAIQHLERNANPRLVMDVLVLRLPHPRSTSAPG